MSVYEVVESYGEYFVYLDNHLQYDVGFDIRSWTKNAVLVHFEQKILTNNA